MFYGDRRKTEVTLFDDIIASNKKKFIVEHRLLKKNIIVKPFLHLYAANYKQIVDDCMHKKAKFELF